MYLHTYFPAEYFLGLNFRLGTRVTSIFQTLYQNQEVYFQPSWTSPMELFYKNNWQVKAVQNFRKRSSIIDVWLYLVPWFPNRIEAEHGTHSKLVWIVYMPRKHKKRDKNLPTVQLSTFTLTAKESLKMTLLWKMK